MGGLMPHSEVRVAVDEFREGMQDDVNAKEQRR
jgi:hypothetical protein